MLPGSFWKTQHAYTFENRSWWKNMPLFGTSYMNFFSVTDVTLKQINLASAFRITFFLPVWLNLLICGLIHVLNWNAICFAFTFLTGSMNDDYRLIISQDPMGFNNYTATGSSTTLISARVSYTYNLLGPCLTLDTACSSGLMAIHLGCQAILTGKVRSY